MKQQQQLQLQPQNNNNREEDHEEVVGGQQEDDTNKNNMNNNNDKSKNNNAAEEWWTGCRPASELPNFPVPPSSIQQNSRRRSYYQHPHCRASNMLHGTLDPDGGVEVVFYDARQTEYEINTIGESVVLSSIKCHHQYTTHNHYNNNSPHRGVHRGGDDFPRSPARSSASSHHHDSIEVSHDQHQELRRQKYSFLQQQQPTSPTTPSSSVASGATISPEEEEHDEDHHQQYPPLPPPPPTELPLRFLRAGKGDPTEGLRRYEATLEWRSSEQIDTVLREPNFHFDLIKKHYPHYCYGRGKNGEPVYYEQPPQTNLKALREGGVSLQSLLRHYIMVAEFQWQFVCRDDLQRSIYIIDLNGIRFGDFVGEVVDFVKIASKLSAQHYPERAGYVFVINVPVWFKVIWTVVKPIVDEATLEKIYILKPNEIMASLQERIDISNIPAEYGGNGPPLAESHEEIMLSELVKHNNCIADGRPNCNGGSSCQFCSWVQPRSY